MRSAFQMRSADRAAWAFGTVAWLAATQLAAPPASGQCRYEVTWVGPIQGPFGPSYGTPTGMNNRGQIVGYFVIGDAGERGFVWSQEDGLTLLPMPPGAYAVSPADINDAGQIIGTVNSAGWAFLWDPEDEEYVALGIPPGGNYSNAHAINGQGQVVGVWGGGAGNPARAAFLWEDGVMTDLGPLLGTPNSAAADISEDGRVAGWMGQSANTSAHAYVLDGSTIFELGPIPGCATSGGEAINELGDLCGQGASLPEEPFRWCGFLWIDGAFFDIGPIGGNRHSKPTGIAAWRQVVGFSSNPHTAGYTWRDNVQTDLSTLVPEDHRVGVVAGIDRYGRIAASVHAPPLGRGAALLTPITTPADLNIDCRVDLQDLLLLLLDFGCAGGDCEGDVNQDGQTSVPDLAIVLTNWSP